MTRQNRFYRVANVLGPDICIQFDDPFVVSSLSYSIKSGRLLVNYMTSKNLIPRASERKYLFLKKIVRVSLKRNFVQKPTNKMKVVYLVML